MATELFSTPDAAYLAGVSYRQIDYWLRIGVVDADREANGSGSRRGLTGRQVVILAAVAEVVGLGLNPSSLRRMVDDLTAREDLHGLVFVGPVGDATGVLPEDRPASICLDLSLVRKKIAQRRDAMVASLR